MGNHLDMTEKITDLDVMQHQDIKFLCELILFFLVNIGKLSPSIWYALCPSDTEKSYNENNHVLYQITLTKN